MRIMRSLRVVCITMSKTFTITKRICKHGSQAVITIPKLLEHELKPGMIAEVKLTILGEVEA